MRSDLAGRRRVVPACGDDPDLPFRADIAPRAGRLGPQRRRQREETGIELIELLDLCLRCPIRAACRAYGMAHPDLVGVWGMFTTLDRALLRLDAQRAALRRRRGGCRR